MTIEGKCILVLGGTGFLGSSLLEPLLCRGCQVRVYSRGGQPEHPVLGVEYLTGDISDRNRLRQALAGAKLVAHFADATLPQTAEDDPLATLSANLDAAFNILTLCAAGGVERLLYCSSGGTVYGIPQTLPILENAVPAPISSYGLTKYVIENAIRYFGFKHGLDYVICRPSNIYGPGQSPFRQQGIIAVAMLKTLRQEAITVFGDGSVIRDYLYIDDLTDFFLRCLGGGPGNVTVNVGSGRGYAVNEVLELIRKVSGQPLAVECLAVRSFDVPANYLDIDLANRLYGWKPRVGLEEGLRLTFAAFKKRFA